MRNTLETIIITHDLSLNTLFTIITSSIDFNLTANFEV